MPDTYRELDIDGHRVPRMPRKTRPIVVKLIQLSTDAWAVRWHYSGGMIDREWLFSDRTEALAAMRGLSAGKDSRPQSALDSP